MSCAICEYFEAFSSTQQVANFATSADLIIVGPTQVIAHVGAVVGVQVDELVEVCYRPVEYHCLNASEIVELVMRLACGETRHDEIDFQIDFSEHRVVVKHHNKWILHELQISYFRVEQESSNEIILSSLGDSYSVD